MRKLRVLVAGALTAGLVAGLAPAAGAAPVVPDPLFGQHVARISSGVPASLPSVGAIRLWDSGVAWRSINPAPGKYNWAPLDRAVAHARALGAKEILYTMGSTPRWAASNPNSKLALYGPGANSHPKSNAYYTTFVKELVRKYPAITSVQVWNEANLPDFYVGSPAQMAALTKDAYRAIKSVRPSVKVVAASTTVRAKGPTTKWGKAYGPAMKKAKAWKYVDVVSAHFYPPAKEGPATRVKYIKVMKKYYKKYGAKGKPIWDTEMNYGDLRSYMKVKRAYTGATAQTYVARTYIDSMRYGVYRVFWYLWDAQVLGTAMTTKGKISAGGVAYMQVRSWMSGKTWKGCKVKSKVTTCTVVTPGGTKQAIKYTSKKKKAYAVPAGAKVHYLNGAVVPGGRKINLTSQPVLIDRV